jgi:hypothetical protein
MDIAGISMGMSQINTSSQVGISLLKMSMDDSKEVAGRMTEMLGQAAVNPNVGQNLDVCV